MMALPYGEEITIVGRTMWTQSTSVTDKQTDRLVVSNWMIGYIETKVHPIFSMTTFQT